MYFIHCRELSFTLADDIYIRYLSFTGADDLEAEMIKRFYSIPKWSQSLFQCLDALTRLTLVRFTMLDQAITRSWPTFHRRLSSNLESNWFFWKFQLWINFLPIAKVLFQIDKSCRNENWSLTLTWQTTMMSETAAAVPRFVQSAGGEYFAILKSKELSS